MARAKSRFAISKRQPDPEYRRDPGIAQSGLKSILTSPAHYKAAQKRKWPCTPNMTLGSALHCISLEGPETFDRNYVRRPDDLKLTTKEGKAWAAEQKSSGRDVLTADQWESVHGMNASLASMEWFDPKRLDEYRDFSELSIYWEWCGMDCKARLDRLIELEDKVLVLDLKTTDSVSEKKFIDKVIYLNYMFQAAYYSKAASVAFGKPAEFIFVGVEREAPYTINLFTPTVEMMEEGTSQCEHALETLKECLITDYWPAPVPKMLTMDLPQWYVSPVPEKAELLF